MIISAEQRANAERAMDASEVDAYLQRKFDMFGQDGVDATCVEFAKIPNLTFEQKMAASDTILPRYVEDLVDALEALGGTIPAELATKVADKKQLRSNG